MEQTQISHHYHGTQVSDRALLVQGNIYYNIALLIVEEEWARYRGLSRQTRRRYRRKAKKTIENRTRDAISTEAEGLSHNPGEAQLVNHISAAIESASEDEVVQENFRQRLNARARSVYRMSSLPKSSANAPTLSPQNGALQTLKDFLACWDGSVFHENACSNVRCIFIPRRNPALCHLETGSCGIVAWVVNNHGAISYVVWIAGVKRVGLQFDNPSSDDVEDSAAKVQKFLVFSYATARIKNSCLETSARPSVEGLLSDEDLSDGGVDLK